MTNTTLDKLNITAILAADLIPNEPMTLAELHKLNGGFPFKAKRLIAARKITLGFGLVGEIITPIAKHRQRKNQFHFIESSLLVRDAAVWTFA